MFGSRSLAMTCFIIQNWRAVGPWLVRCSSGARNLPSPHPLNATTTSTAATARFTRLSLAGVVSNQRRLEHDAAIHHSRRLREQVPRLGRRLRTLGELAQH